MNDELEVKSCLNRQEDGIQSSQRPHVNAQKKEMG
jgi:hypothetical protein